MTARSRQSSLKLNDRLILRTLGETGLYESGAPGQASGAIPLVGKQFALLAYLACAPGRAASRAILTDLFAPVPTARRRDDDRGRHDGNAENAEKRAADAVRNLLQQLRVKLGADAL